MVNTQTSGRDEEGLTGMPLGVDGVTIDHQLPSILTR
jgi:hypothetical protein